MAEIINLNQVRKARAKAEKEAKAAANRAAFGRTRAEKQAETKSRTKAARQLDGHRLDPQAPDDEPDASA